MVYATITAIMHSISVHYTWHRQCQWLLHRLVVRQITTKHHEPPLNTPLCRALVRFRTLVTSKSTNISHVPGLRLIFCSLPVIELVCCEGSDR